MVHSNDITCDNLWLGLELASAADTMGQSHSLAYVMSKLRHAHASVEEVPPDCDRSSHAHDCRAHLDMQRERNRQGMDPAKKFLILIQAEADEWILRNGSNETMAVR